MTTTEFAGWYAAQSDAARTKVDARLDNMKNWHFGNSRSLGNGLFELKWENGMRVYYSRKRIASIDSIVLWGGDKTTQTADIKKARTLKTRYEHELEKGS